MDCLVLKGSQQNEFRQAVGAKDEDGIDLEVPLGSVIFSTNKSFIKALITKLTAFAGVMSLIKYECVFRTSSKQTDKERASYHVGSGNTYSEKMEPVYRDVLPIPEKSES